MPLTVEDGTGVEGADAYISVEDLEAYIEERHPGTEIDYNLVEPVIRRASTYLDITYGKRWLGYRTYGREQGLDWPRTNVYDRFGSTYRAIDGIPREVISATCEAAIREMASPHSLIPDAVSGEKILEETIGPISTTYANSMVMAPTVSIIDQLLEPLLSSSGRMTAFLKRA